MTIMTFVNCNLFNAYTCQFADKCFYKISPFSNPSFLWAMAFPVAGQFAVIYFPPLQSVFQTEALLLGDLFVIVCLSSTVLLLDTIRKKFLQQYCSNHSWRSIFRRRIMGSSREDTKGHDGKRVKRRKKHYVLHPLCLAMGPAFGQEFFGSLTRDFLPYKELLYCVFWVSAGACGPDAGFPIMTSPHFTQVAVPSHH